MIVGGYLCALRPLGWERCLSDDISVLNCPFYTAVPNCPGAKLSWCQIVFFSLRCQIVPFTLQCQIVMVPNCPILHSWCQIVLGAKLSSFTLLVPNCPGAKLSSVPNCLVPNCPGAKLSVNMGGAKLSAVPNCPGAKLSRHPASHSLLVFVSDGAADDKLGGLKHTNILSSAQALKLEWMSEY